LGSSVSAIQHDGIMDQLVQWSRAKSFGHYIVVANTHVLMEARRDPLLRQAVDAADLVIPDGMPLVVVGRLRGFPLKRRADGPGLMAAALDRFQGEGLSHYFYGGTPESLRSLRETVAERWPSARVAGAYAPPFRRLSIQEDDAVVGAINAARPDVLWVGLGCPKQERWMLEHRERLKVPVMLGVGQAFDLLSGVKRRAPAWMCNCGLEWFYRFTHEPRTWKRYLLCNPQFVTLAVIEQLRYWRSHRSN
jgi:N-acetylglucosaminyldiphosphoundecaprenol N-acetyl-beta-D-mannosaminyltransferase